jgi:hypothetical protein
MKEWIGNTITVLPNSIIIFPHYNYGDSEYKHYNNLLPFYDRAELPFNPEIMCNFYKSINEDTPPISKDGQKRIKYAINLLQNISPVTTEQVGPEYPPIKFKMNFITLTLPASQINLSDKDLKEVYLKRFLERMKYNYKMHHYIWVSERQQNGNLHFHLVTNKFVRYDNIRNHWNNSLSDSGLIDTFYNSCKRTQTWQDGFMPLFDKNCYTQNLHNYPPSTEVRAVWKSEDLVNEFTKYLNKATEQKQGIDGKLWDCSHSLQYSNRLQITDTDPLNELTNWVETTYPARMKEYDYFRCYKLNLFQKIDRLPERIKTILKTYIADLDSL